MFPQDQITSVSYTHLLRRASRGCKCRAMSASRISSICRTDTEGLMAGVSQSMRRRKNFSGMTLSHPVSYTHLILDALVDGVQRPSENGISDVMGIIQNGSQ